MQDSKENAWSTDYDSDVDLEDGTQEAQEDATDEPDEKDGWQQYRKWISKAPAPARR